MRLWTLHPRYLDRQGLLALWREGLLAQKVLRGGTRGYRSHPQLTRFRAAADPLAAITTYLSGVREEALRRGYAFDASRIAEAPAHPGQLPGTTGQLAHEWSHLLAKLERRSPDLHAASLAVEGVDAHPLFEIVDGPVAEWERGVR